MEEAIKDGGRRDLVVEDLAPIHEALVAGDDEAGPLVAPDQQPEEEAGLLPRERQVPELVEDQDARIGQLRQDPVEAVLMPGPARGAPSSSPG